MIKITIVLLIMQLNTVTGQNPLPLYLTFVSHNEEPPQDEYLNNHQFYMQNREMIVQLAQIMKIKGAMWNFQSDWNFLKAVQLYDTGSVTINTNNKNIIKWLVEDMGFEADPHAHETQYNYADIAYLYTLLGVTPTRNVGGFLCYPPANYQHWPKFENGIYGNVYPTYFWKPDNLWGGGEQGHTNNDDRSYGIWKPQDSVNFYQHDSSKHLLNIGGGCYSDVTHINQEWDGVKKILQWRQNLSIPDTGFYTATIFIPQSLLVPQLLPIIGNVIDSINNYVNMNQIIWSSLSNTANIWRVNYNSQPFRIDCYTQLLNTHEENVIENEIQIYPNPTSEIIKIATHQSDYSIELFNNLGQNIYKENNINQINIHRFPEGFYYLVITDKKGLQEIKKLQIIR